MDTVLERLQLLESKVRETLAELERARGEREELEAKVQSLQAALRSREEEVAAHAAERERGEAELTRLRAERDEIRLRVEGLLGEIARLETAVQGVGG